MVIDPRTLLEEMRTFRATGLLASDQRSGDRRPGARGAAATTGRSTPSARRGPNSIGSTKRGIGPTYESKAARTGVRVEDLIRPDRFRKALERNLASVAPLLHELGAPAAGPRTPSSRSTR